MRKLEIQLGKRAMAMLEAIVKGKGTTPAEEAELLIHRLAEAGGLTTKPVPKRRVRPKLGGL